MKSFDYNKYVKNNPLLEEDKSYATFKKDKMYIHRSKNDDNALIKGTKVGTRLLNNMLKTLQTNYKVSQDDMKALGDAINDLLKQ